MKNIKTKQNFNNHRKQNRIYFFVASTFCICIIFFNKAENNMRLQFDKLDFKLLKNEYIYKGNKLIKRVRMKEKENKP